MNDTHSVMTRSRKISLAAGILYVLTFVSIPTIAMYAPVKSAHYILGTGSDNGTIIAALLEIVVAMSGIATAVVLYPVLKKQNEILALGLVAARILESATIFVGVSFLLSIVSLRQAGAGAEALVISRTLAMMYDRIFLLGQSYMPAVCDMLLGYMLYKSRLVPKGLSLIGIVGGPVLLVGYLAVIFGVVTRLSTFAGLSALPVALFELSFGVWLIVRGFSIEAVAKLDAGK